MDNDLAEINVNYSSSGSVLSVEGNYHFKKSKYISGEYSRIKNYIDIC
jgi:hypothetical protein